MQTVTVDRPNWDVLEVHCFSDIHLGDLLVDGKLLQERIQHCEETENCIVILNGDLCNNATKSSVSDVYAESIRPMEQLKTVERFFGKLAEQKKIVALTDGNHERRTYKNDGIDLSQIIASQLDVPYSPGAVLLFVRFGEGDKHNHHGRKQLYTVFCNHGSGGGSKVGGKANRLLGMSEIIDADVYFHSHTHEPLVVKRSFFRTSPANKSVSQVDRLFVNTSAYLDYGGYGEIAEYAPSSKATPIVYLDGHRRQMIAKL